MIIEIALETVETEHLHNSKLLQTEHLLVRKSSLGAFGSSVHLSFHFDGFETWEKPINVLDRSTIQQNRYKSKLCSLGYFKMCLKHAAFLEMRHVNAGWNGSGGLGV